MSEAKEYTMFLMKTGEQISVPVEDFEDFIEKNRDNIQPQDKKMLKRRLSPMFQKS